MKPLNIQHRADPTKDEKIILAIAQVFISQLIFLLAGAYWNSFLQFHEHVL